MKHLPLMLALLIPLAGATAAEQTPAAQPSVTQGTADPLFVYPKNLARIHLGTNLLTFDTATQSYVPTAAAGAWVDDDITTGFAPAAGKQYFLLALAEPELLTNFCISAEASAGTISIYAGDAPAVPNASTWTLLAKDVSIQTINEKKLAKPFSRFAKYVLIETNLQTPREWYSVNLYGERPAVSYHFKRREQKADATSAFGPYADTQTTFSLSSLYANGRVSYAHAEDYVKWQQALDDNPETGIAVAPSGAKPGLVVRYGQERSIHRVSVLAERGAKGKIELFLIDEKAQTAPAPVAANKSNYIQVALSENSPAAEATDRGTPAAVIHLDGTNDRGHADFPAVKASALLVRWSPEDSQQRLAVREVNSFGDADLADSELVDDPDALGQISVDGKSYNDFKALAKQVLPPIGEFIPSKAPFLPGTLGFPPVLTNRFPGEEPVSP